MSGRWAVSTPHSLASTAGAEVLRAGGTAVDAALAAAAVLAVVYPHQCSIGGDLIALVGTRDGGADVVNSSGRAPARLDVEALRSRHAEMPVDGALPVTVPGVVAGWHELAVRWGRRPLSAALVHAAGLAREGVPVSPGLARAVAEESARIAADPGLAEVLMPDGEPLTHGTVLRQPRLGRTLELLAADPNAFYTGEIAGSIVAALRAGGSAMTVDDFAAQTVTLERPLTTPFADSTYLTSGGNTQGGFFLAGLRVVDALAERLGRTPDPLGDDAGPLARVLARLGMERDARLGDRDPADGGGDWLETLLTSRDTGRVLLDRILTGTPAPRHGAGRRPSGDTVAVVAADSEGQWVSLIQSVFHAFGSGVLDPETGVVLHNRGASFDLRPGTAGELRAGRRPPHTLMPVLVQDSSGRPLGAHGAMGGRAQPQIHTHLAVGLALGRSVTEVVAGPRWVVGRMEAGTESRTVVHVESDVPLVAREALAATGLALDVIGTHDDGVGHAQLVRAVVDEGTPTAVLTAASDPRADGIAVAEGS